MIDSVLDAADLPEELESMVPGPELAVLLAGVSREALSDRDRVRLARARNRLVSHEQAELMSDLYAVTWDEPPERATGGVGRASRYPWAEAEVAFALTWTATSAGGRLEDARRLIEDLPKVHAALRAGEIDVPKALVIRELLELLDDDDAARGVVDRVIERAAQWTTGQLRARLRRLVLSVDPQAAVKRCATGVKARRVELLDNPDGTGELWGRSLPPQDAVAAWERLTAIAKTAKNAGDHRSMGQLRADAMLDLLCGEGIAIGGPISVRTAGLVHDGGVVEAGTTVEGAFTTEPGGGADSRALSAREAALQITGDVPQPGVSGAGVSQALASQPGVSQALASEPGVSQALASEPGVAAGPPPRRGTVELRVPLLTLLRLAEMPGELGGFGPVVADIARQVAERQRDGTWRFSVYNEFGELGWHGITRKRPTAEIAAFVRARDGTCRAPGCRRVASSCDLDHTVDKTLGGHSGRANMGSLCRLHHMFKHADGCRLTQLSPGVFGWTTPRGLHYVTRPDRPLADSVPP